STCRISESPTCAFPIIAPSSATSPCERTPWPTGRRHERHPMNTVAPAWKMDRDAEGIVWLTLDKPGTSTNVLGRAILEELSGLLDTIEANPPKGLVIRSGKQNGFVAGADIKEFTAFKSATDAYAVI